jgi:uncharacterized repeat protein (TIGR03803 family)
MKKVRGGLVRCTRNAVLMVLAVAAAAIASSAQSFTTLVSFNLTNGSEPFWPLTQGSDGYLYGTTFQGGRSGCCGVIYKMTPGIFTVIYNFSGPDGQSPEALVAATDGNLYGTTYNGGTITMARFSRLLPAAR